MGKQLFLLLTLTTVLACQHTPKQSLNLYNWTYYIPDEVLAQFEHDTGIHVNLDTYDSNETMYAKLVSSNANFDITVPSGDYVSIMSAKKLLAPINVSLIPNISEINPQILKLIQFDPQNQYSVPYFMGAAGIHVNTKEVPEYQQSWSIFDNTKLKNRMTMMNDMREVLGDALKFLGYSVNSTNKDELEQAKKVVLGWKQNLLKFDAESFGKDFANKNIVVAQGYAEIVLKELDPDSLKNHTFFLPKEGGPMYIDNLVILNTSKKQVLAHQLINYLLQPHIHAQIADIFAYPTIIPAADALRKVNPAYQISDLIRYNYEFKNDLGEAISLYNQIWDEINQGY